MRRIITTWITAVLLIFGLSINVDAQVEQTCSDIFGTNQTANVSGEWGSITFDDTSSTLGVVVAEGWEVRVCVKTGSAQQGDGPEDLGWFGEGSYTLSHSTGKELSHFSFAVREVPPPPPPPPPPPTTTTTVIGPPPPPPPPPTTTVPGETTTSSGVTTTTLGDTTTTAPTTTTTLPGESTTAPGGPTTTHNTPSPEDTLPFTGSGETAGLIAVGVSLLGLGSLLVRRRDEVDTG